MVRTPCIVLALALAGCVAAQRSPSVSYEGAAYHLVTGKRLNTAFVGKKIRYPDPYRMGDIILISSARCDGFYPDGRYLSCGDRVPRREGTFEIYSDRVCVIVGGSSRCYQLYRSRTGLYLLGHPREQPSFEPISFVPAADDTVAPRM